MPTRSAHLEPSARTGAPLAYPVEVSGWASTVSSSSGDGEPLTAARWDASGELRVRVNDRWDVDALGGGSSLGQIMLGAGAQVTFPVSRQVRLATALELRLQSLDYTGGPDGSGTSWMPIFSAAEIVRFEPIPHVGFFGSVTLRDVSTAYGLGESEDDDGFSSPTPSGPTMTFYLVGAAGADLRLGRVTVAALAYVSTGLAFGLNPTDYGPGFLMSLSFALGH